MSLLRPLALCALLICAPAVLAAEPATQLTLTGHAQDEVDNDQVSVQLYVQQTQADPARLADALNRVVKRGLADANRVAGIEVSGGQSRTWPQYDRDGHINGWQGRGEIRLRGKQTPELAQLVGRMQAYMQVDSVQFSVSDGMRRSTEARLIADAIRDLQARAREVSKTLGKPRMEIRELTLTDQANQPGPRPLLMMKAMSAEAGVTPPSWQTGKSTISVEVMGKVELQ